MVTTDLLAKHKSRSGSLRPLQFASRAGWYRKQPLTDASCGTHCWRLVHRLLSGLLLAALVLPVCGVASLGAQVRGELQRPPLSVIREALIAGDTARAVELLVPRDPVTPALDSRTLTDLLLLSWIGRTGRHSEALKPWRDAERVLRKPVDPSERSEAALVFRAAQAVAQGEVPDLFAELGAGAELWRERFADIAARCAESDSLLAGAIRWLFAFADLRQIEWFMAARMPTLPVLPPACWRGGPESACWKRGAPPPAAALAALFAQDSSNTLDMLRLELDAARAAVWPYNVVGARVRVAVAIMLGDRAALAAFAEDTAGLPARDAEAVRVTAFAFGGRRDRAAAEMAAHPEWYAALDAEIGELDAGGLAPPLFWRLAWPLFLQPYNERLVTHRARLLLADVVEHGMGDTTSLLGPFYTHVALVRRGVPRGLAMARSPPSSEVVNIAVVSFVPSTMHETVVRLGRGAVPHSLDLALAARADDRMTTYSGYVADHYDQLVPFDHQVVQYVRDGHRMVDVHAARPVAPLCKDPHPTVGFFLLDGALQMLRQVTDTAPRRRHYRFRMVLAPAVYIYSLELLDASCRMAARARYVLTVPSADTTRLSDLVLADQVTLEEPVRVRGDPPMNARPQLRVSAGEPVQFYWEAYGLDATEQERDRLDVHFEVVNVTQDRVALEQLGRLESTARRTKPLMDLRYRATVPPGSGPLGFGLSVTVPEGARGVYMARLTVRDRRTGWEETARRSLYVESGS